MNRRDLLKTFAAIMVALGFGKAKTKPLVIHDDRFELKFADNWPSDWQALVNETVTMPSDGYLAIADELIEITPNGLKRHSESSATGYKVTNEGLHVFSVTTTNPATWGMGWAPLEEYKPPAK